MDNMNSKTGQVKIKKKKFKCMETLQNKSDSMIFFSNSSLVISEIKNIRFLPRLGNSLTEGENSFNNNC
jgi:hypothetical protein